MEVGRLWTDRRLTLLHGCPGVGKSVLLRAGVIPHLRREGRPLLPVGRVTHHVAFPQAAIPPQNPFVFPLLASWAPDESPERFFEMSIEQFMDRHPGSGVPGQIHLCIEQAELLFRMFPGREEQRERLLKGLGNALQEHSGLRLLLVLRTSRLQAAQDFADQLADPKITTGVFELNPLDRRTALQALAPTDGQEDGRRPAGDDWRGLLVDELRTIRAPDQSKDRTSSIDPSLFGLACARLGPELGEGRLNLASEVNRILGEYTRQSLDTIAADHELRRSLVEAWFRDAFVSPARSGPGEGGTIPVEVLRALEDKRLIRTRSDSAGVSYEIQHPRLLEAVRARVDERAPANDPDASTRLKDAAEAFWSGNLRLARVHAESALRECRPQDLELRARTECLLGDLSFTQGLFPDAIEKYEAAVEKFEALRKPKLVGYLLCAIGRLHGKTDPPNPAEALQNLYAAAARLPNDPHVQKALRESLR